MTLLVLLTRYALTTIAVSHILKTQMYVDYTLMTDDFLLYVDYTLLTNDFLLFTMLITA